MKISTLSAAVLALAVGSSFAPAARAEPEFTIKLASLIPEGTPWSIRLNEWKKIAEEKSGGKLKIKLFLGGKLGSENDVVLACKRGQIQAVAVTTTALATQVPELNVLDLPYLFDTPDQADGVLDSPAVRGDIEKYMSDRGYVLAFWTENGFRNFGANFPLTTAADLKGKKMRSQENPVHLEFYRALGASPVPIPSTEALTAIQTGVVDGYDQTPIYTFAASWYTVSKNYLVTNHMYQPALIAFNKDTYDKLPADVKDAMKAAAAAVQQPLRADLRAMAPVILDNLKAAGLNVVTPSAEQLATFKSAAEVSRKSYLKGASAGERALAAKITAALKKK